MKRKMDICWSELIWQRPFELDAVYEAETHLASTVPRGPVVFEVRASKGKIRYLLGADRQYIRRVQDVFKAHGDVRFRDIDKKDRTPVAKAKQLKISRPVLSLKTDMTLSTIRAGLAAMANLPKGAEAVLQIILGPSVSPRPAPREMPDPHASWFQVAMGNVHPATAESLASIREKSAQSGFSAAVRLGIGANTAHIHFFNILSALRTVEAAGVHIEMRDEKADNLNTAHVPWHFPLCLSCKELANFLLLPAGEAAFAGVAGLHPKVILPPQWYKDPEAKQDRGFAVSADLSETRLSIAPSDALLQTHILGPIGSGKSNLMLNLILADIKAGRSVLVIDPKGDLVNDVLARTPEKRDKDVILIDPTSPNPVGFNPFAFKDYGNPPLIADAVLAVFQEVFKDNWGIRSRDQLSAAFLTLAQTEGASLLWLPALLTNKDFRQKITAKIKDKIGLEPFWAEFETMKDSERRAEIAPVLNKIRQFLLRESLRNVLGQSRPKFNLTDLFTKRKIVLVPLNKGVIGAESAQLLGSLIVSLTWTLARSRVGVPPEKRHMVSVYIDELQDYLRLPCDLSDALAQARGLGVALTMAHQYRGQLSPEIRAGIDANARNKIIFGLNAEDAKAMAAMAPNELKAEDFMSLPQYEIYTNFQSNGRSTGWLSGKTLPPPEETREAYELQAKSMSAYGIPAETVEAEYLEILEASRNEPLANSEDYADKPIGRIESHDEPTDDSRC